MKEILIIVGCILVIFVCNVAEDILYENGRNGKYD